jgi:GDP-L-fucose synthase
MGFWKRQTVFVTGGHGFVGRNLVAALRAAGANVVAPSRRELDLSAPGAARTALEESRPDCVFHLAARVGSIAANIAEPANYLYDNAFLTLEVIHAAWQARIKRLVTLGSICAYPKGCRVPLQEKDYEQGYPEPTNAPYAIAKRLGLTQLQAYRQQHGFSGIYLIPSNLYGPHDHFGRPTAHVVPSLLQKCRAATREGHPSIELWGTGKPTRDFLYVGDAVDGMLLAAEHYDQPEPLNLGSGKETSIRELAESISSVTAFEGTLRFDTSKPDGEMRRSLDSTLATAALDFQPRTTLESGLRQTYEWLCSHVP